MPRAADDTPLSDVIVDDSETDKIQYIAGPSTGSSDGKWGHTSVTGEDFYYQGTLSSCTTQGCRLEFPFKGTAVAAYGVTTTMDNTSSWWQVDNGKIYVFEPDREELDRTYHVRFYQSEELEFGQHTLYANVTYLQGGILQLDWIEYNTTSNSTSTSTSSSGSSLSPTATTLTSPQHSSSATTPPPDSNTSHRGLSTARKGMIVGVVLGAVVIFALLYLLYRLWRKRRSEGHAYRLDSRPDTPPPPFSVLYDADVEEESATSNRPRYSSDTGLSASMAERQPMLSATQPPGFNTLSASQPARASDMSGRTDSVENGQSQRFQEKGRLHGDPRASDETAGAGSEELPPAYSP